MSGLLLSEEARPPPGADLLRKGTSSGVVSQVEAGLSGLDRIGFPTLWASMMTPARTQDAN
ncbi:hypothetical protein GCM10009853_012930 [Glycomyces scopariae]